MSYGPAGPPANYRIPLYAAPSRASRTLIIIICVLSCLWIVVGIAAVSSIAAYFGGWIAGIVLLLAVGFPTVLRTGAWLEGTDLVVRGALLSRRCDLAASAVRLTEDQKTGLPVLTAQAPSTGQQVSVLLREPKRKILIAPQKLQALSNAVMSGGLAGTPSEQVAGQLTWLADNWPGTRSPSPR
jgi:hypothetical protein